MIDVASQESGCSENSKNGTKMCHKRDVQFRYGHLLNDKCTTESTGKCETNSDDDASRSTQTAIYRSI